MVKLAEPFSLVAGRTASAEFSLLDRDWMSNSEVPSDWTSLVESRPERD